MLRAVLFDAVGTLLVLREPVGVTYARCARDHGLAASPEALQVAFRDALRVMPPMVFPDLDATERQTAEREWWRTLVRATFAAAIGARPADVDCCFQSLFIHYGGAAAWQTAPGAAQLLAALRRRGLRTGVLSNFDYRLPALLDALGVTPLLDTIVLPADAGAAKPDPAIFRCALDRLGLVPAEAAYVGDDADDDIAGATRAGLQAVDVTRVRDLRELAAILGCDS
jgi:putative hydrolase of the HAD superfamily